MVLVLAGCDLVFPYRATVGQRDTGRDDGPGDLLLSESPADGATPPAEDGPQRLDTRADGLTVDGAVPDGAPNDAAADSADVDAASPVRRLRVFVTRGRFAPDFGGLAGGNAICAKAALDAGFGGSWMAWLSDATGSPATRFAKDGWYERLDGVRVADSWADLTDGSLASPIAIDELGDAVSAELGVWTGTLPTGAAAAQTCAGWSSLSSGDTGGRGQLDQTGTNWTVQGVSSCAYFAFRLYCFEQ